MAGEDLGGYDFDAQALEIARQRKMAELLQGQAMKPMELVAPHGRASILNALVPMAQAFMGTRQNKALDQQAQDLAKQRQASMDKWLGSMPQSTPGSPEIPAAPDELGGGPGRPAMLPTEPSATDMMKWGAGGMNFGPAGQKIAEHAISQATASMIPKEPFKVVGNDIWDVKNNRFITSPGTQATRESLIQSRIDANNARMETIRQRSEDNAANRDLRAQIAADNNALRRELAQARADQASAGGTYSQAGTDSAGNPVLLHNKTGDVLTHDDSGKLVPYKGHVYKPGEEKSIAAVGGAAKSINDMQTALDAVEKDPQIYGNRARAASLVPSALGGQTSAVTGLTPEQLQTRSNIAAMTAETTHSMYGTAFSANEAKQARSYLIQPTDPHETVVNKLKGRLALEKAHFANLPQKDKDAYYARIGGGGGQAPAASSDGWGKAEKAP